MANTQAIATSFKTELMQGIHALGTTVVRAGTTKDTIKGALFFASATINAATTVYSATGEVGNSGTYSAGGATFTNANEPAATGTTSFWTPSASITFTGFSAAAFDALLVYNSTQSDKAISVHTFGTQTIVSGTFSLSMPTNDSSTALIRIA